MTIRRLLRKRRDLGDVNTELNELVYTSRFEMVPFDNIERPCLVRFYTKEERDSGRIPPPYSRQGTADSFYITYGEIHPHVLRPLVRPYPASLKQGFDPQETAAKPKLKGMDIFCGGGNFARGIEEGGAVEIQWAVDINKHAMHIYRANLPNPDKVHLYLGSVNDYLSEALRGHSGKTVARPGEVDIIIAGTPCPGFSNINFRKHEDKGQGDVSLVTAFLAYVQFFLPTYAILENVIAMANCDKKNYTNNVFAQVICTLVALGYQVQTFNIDAWSFGSPQNRSRLFISIAAPGYTLLPTPQPSHAYPAGKLNRALGRISNGLPFCERIFDAIITFPYTTIGEATTGLPFNHTGRDTCIRYPDHRTARVEDDSSRLRIGCIPSFPRNSTLVTTRAAGLMHQVLIDSYPTFWNNPVRSRPTSRAWGRVNPDGLISTITTRCSPADAFAGRLLHWMADRCITVLEARRAQGYPDRDVLVGCPAQQLKIVGNSVDRTVALVLGIGVRTAWLATTTPLNSEPRKEYAA